VNAVRLPPAAVPFVAFATTLRANGFAVAPDQSVTFMAAVELLGPRSIGDIRRAAHATLAPPVEQHGLFDALFDAHFLGAKGQMLESSMSEEEDLRVQEERAGGFEPPDSDDVNEAGEVATISEALSTRDLAPGDETALLSRFSRIAPGALPRRPGYRRVAAKSGVSYDLRRALRIAVRNDGEIMRLPQLRRKPRQRNVLLLIDVSGSMKQRSDANLRFAHAVTRASDRCEVFTFGTRLTRITRALKIRDREQALAAAAATVSDWDGGTRIGDALTAFLAVPRFGGYARGAVVVVISDGIERGDHAAMTATVAKLAIRAWRLKWLTPLAADRRFKPETAALQSILPFLDYLGDASTTERLIDGLLTATKERAA